MDPHIQIINESAKAVLKPLGMFRAGQSRTWLDDNGWFVISADYEPSAYEKGSYIAVGICFLWEKTEGLRAEIYYDYGGRIAAAGDKAASYVTYCERDARYEQAIARFSDAAAQKVQEYRRFRDPAYARQMLEQRLAAMPEAQRFWECYDLAMLCFLSGDYAAGMPYLQAFLQTAERNTADWANAFAASLRGSLQTAYGAPDAAKRAVCEMILRRRTLLHNRASYRKLQPEPALPFGEA